MFPELLLLHLPPVHHPRGVGLSIHPLSAGGLRVPGG